MSGVWIYTANDITAKNIANYIVNKEEQISYIGVKLLILFEFCQLQTFDISASQDLHKHSVYPLGVCTRGKEIQRPEFRFFRQQLKEFVSLSQFVSVLLQFSYNNLSYGQIILCDWRCFCCNPGKRSLQHAWIHNETVYEAENICFPLQYPVLEENQCELLQNNGLPLMIQLLTESQDEELNKVATFVLKNCKQMSKLTVTALKITEIISVFKFCWLSKWFSL